MMNLYKLSACSLGAWLCVHSPLYGNVGDYKSKQEILCEAKERLRSAQEARRTQERIRDKQKEYRDAMAAELEVTKAKYAEVQKRADAMLAAIKELDALAEAADFSEVVDVFTTVVSDAKTQIDELIPE